MMDALRRSASGWVAKMLIALLALSFGIWGVNDIFRGWRATALATVGSRDISEQEFKQRFDRQLRELSRQAGQPLSAEQARAMGYDRQVLSQMIVDAALDEEARRLGLRMPDAVVAADVAASDNFKNSKGEFDPKTFREILARNGLTEEGFLILEKQARLRQAVAGSLTAGITVPSGLTESAVKLKNEQRDARFFVIKGDATAVADPSADQLKQFYDANQNLFTAPAYRSFTAIVLDPAALASAITVSEDDLKAAFEARKAEYGTPEKRDIQQIAFQSADEAAKAKSRIAGGEDFLAIAKERGLTEADVSLGSISKDALPDPAIAAAAFALAPGTVSDPVNGKLATVLLRVKAVTPATQKSLADVKADLTAKVQLDRAKEQALEIHDKIEDARAGGATFEEIGKQFSLPVADVPAADAQGKDKDGKDITIPAKDEVLKAAFTIEPGVEADAEPTQNDGFVWVNVREAIPEAVKPLDQVKDQAIAEWKKREVARSTAEKAKALAERAAKGETLDALAKEAGAEIKTVTGLRRNEPVAEFGGPALTALFSVTDNAVTSASEPDGSGARVIQAMPVLSPPVDPAAPETKQATEALARSLANDIYGTYMMVLQKDLGVRVNDKLYQQATGAGG